MATIQERPQSVADVVDGLEIRNRAWIDGDSVDAAAGETFDCVSPVTGETITRSPPARRRTSIGPLRARGRRSSRAPGRGSPRRSGSGCCSGSPS